MNQKGFGRVIILLILVLIIGGLLVTLKVMKTAREIVGINIISDTFSPPMSEVESTVVPTAQPNTATSSAEVNVTSLAQRCKDVLAAPIPPNAGITFERSFCQGDYCVYQKDQSSCNQIDVAKIENGKIVAGQDGDPDCRWDTPVETMTLCMPDL